MSRRIAIASLMAAVTIAAVPGELSAQSLKDIEAAEAAVVEAWERTPLSFRKALLIEGDSAGYGVYSEKESAEYAPGEPIVTYAEPVGYAWGDNGDGTYTFGFAVDLLLKRPDGSIVAGQENFEHLELTSHRRNREFTLTLTLTVDGAPPGDYIVEYRVRDVASDMSGLISLPFSITQ